MKMVMVDTLNEVRTVVDTTMSYASGRVQEIVERFAHSDLRTVELVPDKGEYATVASAYGSVMQAIKSTGRPCKASTRKGHLYLSKRI